MRFRKYYKTLSMVVYCAILCGASTKMKADNIAYSASNDGSFGTIDLNTGVFTTLGNSGQTLAGLVMDNGTLYAASYHNTDGTFYQVNPTDGSLTRVGASGVAYDDFGSTPTGLYAISFGATQDLYSIDPTTGAATLIGPTGLPYATWRGLSDNSGTLYFADGVNLYTIDTTTGAASLVGKFGSSAGFGALLTENGTLFGADDVNFTIDTIDTGTGKATLGPSFAGSLSGTVFGLGPNGGVATPEPSTTLLIGAGLLALILARRVIAG